MFSKDIEDSIICRLEWKNKSSRKNSTHYNKKDNRNQFMQNWILE